MGTEVINTVRTFEDLGISQHKEFRENRIIKKTKELHDPITKNKLPLFKSTNTRGQSLGCTDFKELRLYVNSFHKCLSPHRSGMMTWISSLVTKHLSTLLH